MDSVSLVLQFVSLVLYVRFCAESRVDFALDSAEL